MKQLPSIENSLLLRTDFSDDAAWASLCEAAQRPNADGFTADVTCISDPAYGGLAAPQLVTLAPRGNRNGQHTFAFIADQRTFAAPDRPVLVVDLYDQPGRTFRVVPREMWSVENNLSISNMDFDEFAKSVDSDGVFRGFGT